MPISSIDDYTTYNQAGVSYNESGYPYAGISNTTILPDPFSIVLTLPQSSILVGIIVEASIINLLLDVPTSTVSTTSSATLTPDPISLILSTPQSTISIDTLIELGIVSLTSSALSPTIAGVENVYISPSVLELLLSLPSPNIEAVENLNLSIVPRMTISNLKPNSSIKDYVISNIISNVRIQSYAGNTEGQVFDQQLSYNEPGYTYNDARAYYEGFYGDAMVKRSPQFIKNIKPSFI